MHKSFISIVEFVNPGWNWIKKELDCPPLSPKEAIVIESHQLKCEKVLGYSPYVVLNRRDIPIGIRYFHLKSKMEHPFSRDEIENKFLVHGAVNSGAVWMNSYNKSKYVNRKEEFIFQQGHHEKIVEWKLPEFEFLKDVFPADIVFNETSVLNRLANMSFITEPMLTFAIYIPPGVEKQTLHVVAELDWFINPLQKHTSNPKQSWRTFEDFWYRG